MADLSEAECMRAAEVVEQGLATMEEERLVLNLSGRMVADRIITDLLV